MLNSEQRQVFAALAETLIPAGDDMPSATTAEVSGALLWIASPPNNQSSSRRSPS